MTPPQLTNGEDPMTTGRYDDRKHLWGQMEAPTPEHSGLAQEAELHEGTIRACLAALPKSGELEDAPEGIVGQLVWLTNAGHEGGIEKCRAALESLLPIKPDRAEEIVAEYRNHIASALDESVEAFARWAIAKGMLATRGGAR